MPEGELYPGPNHFIWYLPIPILAAMTIYFDIQAQGYTNPFVFFITVVGFPMLFIAMAAGITGKPFLRMFGIGGTFLSNVGMFLIVSGITALIYIPMSGMASLYIGTYIHSAIQALYFPLSSMALKTLSTFPPLYIVGFYTAIAIGEEVIKFFGVETISDYFHIKGRLPKMISIFLGIVISWLGWVLIHAPGNPAIVTLPGLTMAFILSTIWYLPFYVFAESLFDPAYGINWTIYSLAGTIGGHFTWDFLIEMTNFNYITAVHSGLVMVAGAVAIAMGLGMLVYEYWKKSLPIFGFIHY